MKLKDKILKNFFIKWPIVFGWVSVLSCPYLSASDDYWHYCSRLLEDQTKWVHSVRFRKGTNEEVLNEVMMRVELVVFDRRTPIVVFDLDDTVIDRRDLIRVALHGSEVFGINGWLNSKEAHGFPLERKALAALPKERVGTNIDALFQTAGLTSKMAKASFSKRVAEIQEQSNLYEKIYEPYPGIVTYINALQDLGATIVFASWSNGKDLPLLADQKLAFLKRYNMIEGNRIRFIPNFSVVPEWLFKSKLAEETGYLFENPEVVAVFDNDPFSLISMDLVAPKAMKILAMTSFEGIPPIIPEFIFHRHYNWRRGLGDLHQLLHSTGERETVNGVLDIDPIEEF